MALITAIIAFGYLCVNLNLLKDKEIRNKLLVNIIFILSLSAFYIFPFIQTMARNEYAAYQKGMMSTKETVASYALRIKDLVVTQNDSIYVYEITPHILIMLCFSVVSIRRLEYKYKKEYIFFLGLGIFSLIMSTNIFPWKIFGDAFSIIQFPWRMLVFSNFCFAVVSSINMSIVIKKFSMVDVIVISIIAVAYIFALEGFIPKTENVREIQDWNLGYMSGRSDEVIAAMGKGEYLPVNVNNNRFYIASKGKDTISILQGDGIIEDVQKEGAKLKCRIETLDDGTVYEFPYVYYPGYRVTIDGSIVNSFESENGLLSISISKLPKSDVIVEYVGTNMMRFSKIFSIISSFAFILYVIQDNNENKQKGKEYLESNGRNY